MKDLLRRGKLIDLAFLQTCQDRRIPFSSFHFRVPFLEWNTTFFCFHCMQLKPKQPLKNTIEYTWDTIAVKTINVTLLRKGDNYGGGGGPGASLEWWTFFVYVGCCVIRQFLPPPLINQS